MFPKLNFFLEKFINHIDVDKKIPYTINMIGFQTSINNTLTLLEEMQFAIDKKADFFDIFFDKWLPKTITTEEYSLLKDLKKSDFPFTVHLPIEYHTLADTEKQELFVFIKTLQPKTTTVHFDKITLEELQTLYNEVSDYTKISIENTIPDSMCENYVKYLEKAKSVGTIYATLDAGHGFVNGIEAHKLAQKIASTGIEIATLHAHDNDGKKDMHKPVGEGIIDFARLFEEIKKQNAKPYIVIEHWDNNLLSLKNLQKLNS